MSLDTVVEDIREEARARAKEIREEAEQEAEEIVAHAEQDAERIREERIEEIEREIERERERTLSAAKLEAKQERLAARRSALEEARDAVEAAIADMEGERREELTRELLEASLAEFDDEDEEVAVRGRPEDEQLLVALLADYENASYAGEYDCLGGVVAESQASRVRVNNTFDSILESVWDDRLKDLSGRLFEQ